MSTNQKHEANYIVDGSIDPYVYLYNVPNLKELASYEVARGIWCSGLGKFQLDNEQDSSHQERSVQLIKDLNIPRCIKDMLENYLREIGRNITQWARHFLYYMEFPKKFSKHYYDIPSIDPNWLLWSTNGEINCRKTAKNMLQVDCLTNVHKFIIMSVYCMEDEMKKFSLDSLPAEFYSDVDSSNGWVFFYWICYLRNELGKVPNDYLAEATDFNIRDRFVNDYFWSFLSDFDHAFIANRFTHSHRAYLERDKNDGYYTTCSCVVFEKTISKMTCNHQELDLTGDTGIFFFLMYFNSPRCALYIWKQFRNLINVTPFSMIIGELMFRSRHTAAWMSLLAEIWDIASDSLKNRLIHDEMWLNSCIHFCLDNTCLLEFLSKVLHLFSSNERKKLIFEVTKYPFFLECSSESADFIVNLCLPDSEDQLTLKEYVMQSGHFKYYL